MTLSDERYLTEILRILLTKLGEVHIETNESAATEGLGFALSTNEVESKLCGEGTNGETDLDVKSARFTAAVGSHVFISVRLILWFLTGFS